MAIDDSPNKCMSCGYLVKGSVYSGLSHFAGRASREDGNLTFTTPPGGGERIRTIAACYVQHLSKVNLFDEALLRMSPPAQPGITFSAIPFDAVHTALSEVGCGEWVEFEDFRTAQDHWQEREIIELEKQRRQF